MNRPNLDLSTPLACIGWAMALSSRSGEPFTLRQAKRLATESHPDEDWYAAITQLVDDGDLRMWVTRQGKRGRPTACFYPTHWIRITLSKDHIIGTEDSGERVAVAYKINHMEWVGVSKFNPPRKPDPKPEPEPETAREEKVVVPTNNLVIMPKPEPEPACPYCGKAMSFKDDPDGVCLDPECLNSEAQSAAATERAPAPESRPEPERTPEPVSPDQDPRSCAYALMRNLIIKSVKEREGMGCTSHELKWLLEKKGYSEDDALKYLKALAGHEPEAYYEGGLRLEGPMSPRNRTDEPRFFLRTKAQALEPHMAEFEAEKLKSRESADLGE